jgi:hypothetical protein
MPRSALVLVTAIAMLLTAPAPAQRDFLTADEVDQLRLTQEPDPRLRLYLKFARQRSDQLEQLFAKPSTGRSGVIHELLTQLTQIVEAIDTVIDDTLRKGRELESIEFVAKDHRKLLEKLHAFLDKEPPDLDRYQFAMENAIDTLEDSAEMAEEDLRMRRRDVSEREADVRKRRQEMSTPESVKAAEETRAKEDDTKKKRPSLLRKGETLPGKGAPKK